jgi:hypothetical protein
MATTIPPSNDDALTTVELGRLLGKPRQTVLRWVKGITVADRKVRLRARRVGGLWSIAWADWLAFERRLTKLAGGATPASVTPAEFRRRARQADAEIDRIFATAKTKRGA